MKSRLSVIGLCVAIAIVAFVAGSMIVPVNATKASLSYSDKEYIGAVTSGGRIFAVFQKDGFLYYAEAKFYN